MKKVLLLMLVAIMSISATQAQFGGGNLKDKIKRGVNEAKNAADKAKNAADKVELDKLKVNNTASFEEFTANNIPKNAIYVSVSKGSVRGTGEKDSPLKDLQKAIDQAENGQTICLTEGNYLGPLDRGWFNISDKWINVVGGFNEDFSDRDPNKYITRIQQPSSCMGQVKSAVLEIQAETRRDLAMVIDGLYFDLDLMLVYAPNDPTDPRHGCPYEGFATGRMMPTNPNPTIRMIGGSVAGRLIIRNCMFINSSFDAIILTNKGGEWELYNNVFVANLYAAVEIHGGLPKGQYHQCKVNFHHNTVLFPWCRTKEMESMGYGYRLLNGADHDVHHNIFGCANLGAIDNGWSDATLPKEGRKILNVTDNYFFMNKGDMTVPSAGVWIYVPAKRFEEVETLNKYEGNEELPGTSKMKDFIDPLYLKGFANLKIMTTESYDPNSAANLYREAHGLNKQGTSTTRVSMFANRYSFDWAIKLFGAEPGYGAQKIK